MAEINGCLNDSTLKRLRSLSYEKLTYHGLQLGAGEKGELKRCYSYDVSSYNTLRNTVTNKTTKILSKMK